MEKRVVSTAGVEEKNRSKDNEGGEKDAGKEDTGNARKKNHGK